MKTLDRRLVMINTRDYQYRLSAFILTWMIFLLFSSEVHGQYPKNDSEKAMPILNMGNRYDVELILPGQSTPSCRLLLPEHITAEGMEELRVIHTQEAAWTRSGDDQQGTLLFDRIVECGLSLKPGPESLHIEISLKNESQVTYKDIRVNICAGLSHLPNAGNVDWSNRDFIPGSIPLDRELQGKYWYRVVTPERLRAWIPEGDWSLMHLKPEQPEPDSADLYYHEVSSTDRSLGCAVRSTDGNEFFYMVWKAEKSHHQSPFAGNACMHLIPQVADQLLPGEVATIVGKAGFFKGTREELAQEFRTFLDRDIDF
jgi:hypothetical protein